MTPVQAYTLGQAQGQAGLKNQSAELKGMHLRDMYTDGYINGRALLVTAIQSLIDNGEITAEWNTICRVTTEFKV